VLFFYLVTARTGFVEAGPVAEPATPAGPAPLAVKADH
jgi:hypothetical protein